MGRVPGHRAEPVVGMLQLVHPVDQLLLHRADLRLGSSEADGEGRGTVQTSYDPVRADQHRRGRPRVDPLERPVSVSMRIIRAVTKWSGSSCSATARPMKRWFSDSSILIRRCGARAVAAARAPARIG
ncbi:hypothetical protein Snoj_67710 [Streptomyces nojiriensis]|uniref:Uncharacterized protein n=1 Tax=Streptomyces nojiriensis TaxID=66374 RepID=A0ABQ3SXH6_9ACTN|nr:hypothetical protein GCM10010205_79410 [Streptomyces nojiriensis]GHI72853.1 hypothetical protein Snoj_67710 [Streptomyces nojiriensis]